MHTHSIARYVSAQYGVALSLVEGAKIELTNNYCLYIYKRICIIESVGNLKIWNALKSSTKFIRQFLKNVFRTFRK